MKRIALYANATKQQALHWAEYTAARLHALGLDCCAEPHILQQFSPEVAQFVDSVELKNFEKCADFVISFGGDGTVISAARALLKSGLPIMGVNVGKLGFLAEFSTENLDAALADIVSGRYSITDRSMLETTFNGEVICAMNDFVVEKGTSSRMITVRAYVNKSHVADYRADGVILTTPTGSTAYSLSCGGPIITPAASVLCLTPISPHALTLRPLIIPDGNEVTLEVHSQTGDASLVADGQIHNVLKDGQTVTFQLSKHRIKLVKHADTTYFDLLRAKLLWSAHGIDSEQSQR
ncbi:MAG TPA: NAD(+)/NADH kinase [Patescibacteria group bacterium]|nr:NAD(+)/NADH kinase [Patescibacteria group bacterium]